MKIKTIVLTIPMIAMLSIPSFAQNPENLKVHGLFKKWKEKNIKKREKERSDYKNEVDWLYVETSPGDGSNDRGDNVKSVVGKKDFCLVLDAGGMYYIVKNKKDGELIYHSAKSKRTENKDKLFSDVELSKVEFIVPRDGNHSSELAKSDSYTNFVYNKDIALQLMKDAARRGYCRY